MAKRTVLSARTWRTGASAGGVAWAGKGPVPETRCVRASRSRKGTSWPRTTAGSTARSVGQVARERGAPAGAGGRRLVLDVAALAGDVAGVDGEGVGGELPQFCVGEVRDRGVLTLRLAGAGDQDEERRSGAVAADR